MRVDAVEFQQLSEVAGLLPVCRKIRKHVWAKWWSRFEMFLSPSVAREFVSFREQRKCYWHNKDWNEHGCPSEGCIHIISFNGAEVITPVQRALEQMARRAEMGWDCWTLPWCHWKLKLRSRMDQGSDFAVRLGLRFLVVDLRENCHNLSSFLFLSCRCLMESCMQHSPGPPMLMERHLSLQGGGRLRDAIQVAKLLREAAFLEAKKDME